MKNSKLKEILIPTVSLFLICAVVTALLGVTNSVTEPKIQKLQEELLTKTKQSVLSEADTFAEGKEYDGIMAFDGFKNDNKVGTAYRVTEKGYGGDITMMIGVGCDGKVTGVDFLSIGETAGLGMNADTPKFKEQFIGKIKNIAVNKNKPSGNEIAAITGATITSTAVTKGVNRVLELHEKIEGGTNNG